MKLPALAFAFMCVAHPSMAKLPASPSLEGPPQGLTMVDWTQIRAEYERHRHGMFPDQNGFMARSFAQQWLARFDGRGFTVKPDDGVWSWGLELAGVTGKAKIKAEVNRMTYRWSADLDEWFLNDKRGLEHGFTLRAPQEIRLTVAKTQARGDAALLAFGLTCRQLFRARREAEAAGFTDVAGAAVELDRRVAAVVRIAVHQHQHQVLARGVA